MINLKPRHRLHIPNRLAIFAAVLLLISSIASIGSNQEVYSSGTETRPATKVENVDDDSITDAAEHKRRGLNLGLLLFRRG